MGKFTERRLKASDLKEKIYKANSFDRANLLTHSKLSKGKNRIPLVIIYHQIAPNVSKIIRKHWPILQMNEAIGKVFENSPVRSFKRTRNQGSRNKDLLGGSTKLHK